MQRSSFRFIGCLWKQPIVPRQLTHSSLVKRQMGTQGPDKTRSVGDRKTTGETSPGSGDGRGRSKTGGTIRVELSGPRNIHREDNMWGDPNRMDTKWLRPCDPSRYKPDFGKTEPHSLREQFMRSPDQRTRDAMSRDWDVTMRVASNNRRAALMAIRKRDEDLQDEKELFPNKEARRSENRPYRRKSPKNKKQD